MVKNIFVVKNKENPFMNDHLNDLIYHTYKQVCTLFAGLTKGFIGKIKSQSVVHPCKINEIYEWSENSLYTKCL